ncbi:GSCOCG00005533001-RA-CDS [Cotesia congregata]|uniref:ZP domain-containing protein n=1 Tax=Cotesia congregata TaxID=51543 RepID=A0A8J2MMR2_COTCN|nr:GSCOCG00005533001-RA-CDS [Cotesia congregata]CAG5093523.1 Protein of unknown function [Cotesia congregata]
MEYYTLTQALYHFVIAIVGFSVSSGANLDRASLELKDQHQHEVMINFPRKSNESKVATARHLYLPPGEPDFVLPEVIDNRVRSAFQRPISSAIIQPSIQLQTPFPREIYNYLSPAIRHSNIKASDFERDEISGFVRINSMSCKNTDDEAFFKASVIPPKVSDYPVIEGATSEYCKIVKVNDEYRFNFSNDMFWNCGVKDCSTDAGKFYCLSLRFATVSGLKLNEDVKILLKCRTQEKITSHTKRIHVKTHDTSARMAPRVATGGHKNAFETEIGLYRKTLGSNHLFDSRIQPGGTVILGEEILLRVAVREGDGWRYSRISDVTIHHLENKIQKKIINSMWILDSNGCLNQEIREVCSREQYRVTPLESYLIFQAFMFDHMKETDEMVMNVKATGCLDGNDCVINCPAGHSRKTRSLAELKTHNQTINWLDDISFKVILPKNYKQKNIIDDRLIIPYAFSAFIILIIFILLCIMKSSFKQKNPKL